MTRDFARILPSSIASISELTLLSSLMRDTETNRLFNSEKLLYSGLTYLGQFLDHDIVLESQTTINTTNQTVIDVTTLKNKRTCNLDLDSLYGGDNNHLLNAEGLFTIEKNPDGMDDIPRGLDGLAIIGDKRNEENIIIQQLHLLFLKFHNKVFIEIKNKFTNLTLEELISLSKRTVQHHYQFIIINEFLKSITGKYYSRLFDLNSFPIIHPSIKSLNSAMAIEFSGAIYRFGHANVRNNYYLNEQFDLFPLFSQNEPDLSGFKRRPSNQGIDWSMYFPLPGHKGFQEWSPIDIFIADSLFNLPTNVATGINILPLRTMIRGQNVYGLPSGQDLARSLGISENEILSASKGNLIFQGLNGLPKKSELEMLNNVFGEKTPLFFYTLMEAWVFGNGESLGPLGSCVVGQVLLNLLLNDTNSYLNNNFSPVAGEFGCIQNGVYDMTSLICYTLGIKYDLNDILPTSQTNFFDQHAPKQFSVAKGKAHILQNTIDPSFEEILVSEFPGFTLDQFDPTLVLGNSTQKEIDTVATNALKFNLEPIYAVVKFICNKNIEAIATQNLIPISKKIGRPIFASGVVIPFDTKPSNGLLKSQLRARALIDSINDSLTKSIAEATQLFPNCKAEIEQALLGLTIPPSINPNMFLGNDFIISDIEPVAPSVEPVAPSVEPVAPPVEPVAPKVPVAPEEEEEEEEEEELDILNILLHYENLNTPEKITNLIHQIIKNKLNKLKKIKYGFEFEFK